MTAQCPAVAKFLRGVTKETKLFGPDIHKKVTDTIEASSKPHAHLQGKQQANAYLNKRGGTHSQRLSDLTAQVWEWCLTRRITLQEKHIPGRENKGVEKESRRGADPSDWMLLPEVFQEICHRWGPPDVDLFAARHNA